MSIMTSSYLFTSPLYLPPQAEEEDTMDVEEEGLSPEEVMTNHLNIVPSLHEDQLRYVKHDLAVDPVSHSPM